MLRAIKDYDGSDDPTCIALTTDDHLSSVSQLDEYWYWGTNDRTRQTGNFPVSCVEPFTETCGQFTDIKMNDGDYDYESNMKGREKRSDTMGSKVRFTIDTGTKTGPTIPKRPDTKPKTITKHVDVLRTESKDSFRGREPDFMSSTDKLFRSDRGQYKPLKAIAGVVAGLGTGVILFILLRFSFDYSLGEAVAIAGVFTIILSICLAASTFCRCIMALVIPNFFTGKGRAVFLSIIFGVMLSKPVTNITHNAKETGSSMACITEMLVNQSRALQRELAVPVQEITTYVAKQKEDLNRATAGFHSTMNALETQLYTFRNGVKEAEGAVDEVVTACEAPLKSAKDACLSGCDLKIVNFCDECNKISGNCAQIRQAIKATGVIAVAQQAIHSIDEIQDYFRADLEVNTMFNASAGTNKSLDSIQEDVNRDIISKARTFESFIGVLKKVVSLSLALIFFQSFWYLRNYLAKDGYDNIYVTNEFKQLDKQSPNQLLPLKEKEKDVYVMTSSVKLAASELAYCKIGLFQVMLHFILCFLIVTFDIALYYILSQVGKYANVSLKTEAHSEFNVEVKGSGPVAEFYRIMLSSVNLDKSFNMTLNIETCLPKPSTPSMSAIPVFLILYVFALAFVVLRGYGMRLRRKIAAYFYPEQEQDRLEYLHKKIRHKRVGFLKFLRQQIKSTHKESRVKEKLRFSTWLMFNFPCLARCIPERNALECTSCEQKESSFNHIKLTPCKGNTGGVSCDAVYCEECFTALHGVCPICSKDDVILRE